VILSHAPPCKSKEKEKEKKRNINNDFDVLPSHDNILPFFTKMSENKTWAKDPQYDSLWK